jgi:hypothetical protein
MFVQRFVALPFRYQYGSKGTHSDLSNLLSASVISTRDAESVALWVILTILSERFCSGGIVLWWPTTGILSGSDVSCIA